MEKENSRPTLSSGKARNVNEIRLKTACIVLGLALLVALTRLFIVVQAHHASGPKVSAAEAVLSNIHSRKSVRSYTDRPVGRATLDTLVRAAMAAPTAKDMRPWKFVVIDDKEVMKTLAEYLPHAKMLAEAQAAVLGAAI